QGDQHAAEGLPVPAFGDRGAGHRHPCPYHGPRFIGGVYRGAGARRVRERDGGAGAGSGAAPAARGGGARVRRAQPHVLGAPAPGRRAVRLSGTNHFATVAATRGRSAVGRGPAVVGVVVLKGETRARTRNGRDGLYGQPPGAPPSGTRAPRDGGGQSTGPVRG